MLRRLGYVRLRDYNLRATANGMLVPISSDRPVPLDLSRPQLPPPPPRFAQPRAESWPPAPPRELAEGTIDGLESVGAPRRSEHRETRRDHAVPPPPPAPFGGEDEEDELPYRPWTEEP